MKYTITFYDFWNTSSGLSAGAGADILCQRDENGYPFVFGKTVKGLVREAATAIKELNADFVAEDFIEVVLGKKDKAGLPGKDGEAFFGDAALTAASVAEIERDGLKSYLFEEIASTAIEAEGIAKDQSLRRAEFALPCTLYGTINDMPTQHIEQLGLCMNYIKRMGYNRHRGYGRCKISLLQ